MFRLMVISLDRLVHALEILEEDASMKKVRPAFWV